VILYLQFMAVKVLSWFCPLRSFFLTSHADLLRSSALFCQVQRTLSRINDKVLELLSFRRRNSTVSADLTHEYRPATEQISHRSNLLAHRRKSQANR